MPAPISIQDCTESRPVEVGRLSGNDPQIVGREVPDGIRLPYSGVSGEHGEFVPYRSHWLFRDIGSTNGSWVRERKAVPHQYYVVRAGDTVQIADRVLRLVAVGEDRASGPANSLILLSRGNLTDEYPVPHIGRALVIGGTKADLKLDVDIYDLPSLVIERRGEVMVAFSVAKQVPVYVNGDQIEKTVTIADGDFIAVEHYGVLVNFRPDRGQVAGAPTSAGFTPAVSGLSPQHSPPPPRESTQPMYNPPDYYAPRGTVGPEHAGNILAEHEAAEVERSTSKSSMLIKFGVKDEAEQQQSAAPVGGGDLHPAMRHAVEEDSGADMEAFEDKVVLIIGGVLLVALVILLLLWLFV